MIPTPIMEEEKEPIKEFFTRCYEDQNKDPRIAFILPDGRCAYVDCSIKVVQNG